MTSTCDQFNVDVLELIGSPMFEIPIEPTEVPDVDTSSNASDEVFQTTFPDYDISQ